MRLKIGNTTIFLSELIISLLFIVPYIETGKIRELFVRYTSDYYWRGIITIELIIFFLLLLTVNKYRTKFRLLGRRITVFTFYLFVNAVFSCIAGNGFVAVITLLLMLVIPLWNAYLTIKYIDKKHLNVNLIIKYSVWMFTAFVIFCIFINSVRYGMVLSIRALGSVRMVASAGGVVTLGYAISLVLAFLVANRELFGDKEFIIIFCINTLGIIYTQDRGAYVILLIVLIYLYKITKKKILGFFFVIFMILGGVIYIQDIIAMLMPRISSMSNLSNEGRIQMLFKCIGIALSDFIYVPFGRGLNGFFPYQHWQATTNPNDVYTVSHYGRFWFQNDYLMVQPHNTFIYLLMEIGIVGIVLFVGIIFATKKYTICSNNKSSISFIILCILVLCFLESTLVLETGVACVWWLILFLTMIKDSSSIAV